MNYKVDLDQMGNKLGLTRQRNTIMNNGIIEYIDESDESLRNRILNRIVEDGRN